MENKTERIFADTEKIIGAEMEWWMTFLKKAMMDTQYEWTMALKQRRWEHKWNEQWHKTRVDGCRNKMMARIETQLLDTDTEQSNIEFTFIIAHEFKITKIIIARSVWICLSKVLRVFFKSIFCIMWDLGDKMYLSLLWSCCTFIWHDPQKGFSDIILLFCHSTPLF